MKERERAGRLVKLAMLACLVFAFAAPSASAQGGGTVGGPVILGGDDMTDHGSFNGTDNVNGWLYVQRAIENVSAKVQRLNDSSIAALGSADSTDTSGDAGGAVHHAAAAAGLPVSYHNGGPAIQQFFDNLAAGSTSPRIIWIAGSGAGNDLDECSGDIDPGVPSEGQALIDNASRINDFVNSGGGLIAHGTCYAWLQALIPGIETVDEPCDGDCEDLYLTAAGMSAFPGLTEEDINAGPWHNMFEGDFGGLDVLARSNDPAIFRGEVTAAGQSPRSDTDAAVILGGGNVSLTQRPTDLAITKSDDPDPVSVGGELTYAITVTNNGPNQATNVVVTDDLPAGVTFERANASQGSCTGTGPVTCNLGTIPSGSAAAVGIVVRPGSPGTYTNVARVAGEQPDPDTSNNEARTDTGVLAVAGERTCPDTRPFRFRTHHAPGSRIKRVRAFVNGEKVLDRKSKKDIKRFRIPRQPQVAGTVVRIILNHSNGTKVTSLRVYNQCGKTTPTYKIKRKKKSKK